MSYGITSTGYKTKPLDVVLDDAFSLLHSIDPRTATSKGTWIWNVFKTWTTKYVEIDSTQAQIVKNQNPDNAQGFSLDSWASEKGMNRKGASKATCLIKFTGFAADFPIPVGSKVATQNGIEYETTALGILPAVIAVVKRSTATDTIPYPYSDAGDVLWINSSPNQSGHVYHITADWSFTGDTITWTGTDDPAVGAVYYIGLDQSLEVSTTLASAAVVAGASSNVSEGQITVNSSGLSGVSAVLNEYDSVGGTDSEKDSSLIKRLVKTKNTQFGYSRIESMIEELDAVRSCKVYQVTGVDLAFPTGDWNVVGTWTGIHTWNFYAAGDGALPLAQTFVPTGDRLTIKYISLRAQKVGTPPSLRLKLYTWVTDYATTITHPPVSNRVFKVDDVDPDHPTDYQEIQIPCRFGGLDWTQMYLFVVESDGTADISNHWHIAYELHGDLYTGGKMYYNGSAVGSSLADLAFKTRWGGAAYNAIVSTNDGYDFYDWQAEIEEMLLDFESKNSISPICIQGNVIEAETALINVTCTVFIDHTADWTETQDKIRSDLETYMLSLSPGDNVVFSMIEHIIMNVSGVVKIMSCTIEKNNEGAITKVTEADILIADSEVAVLDSGTYGAGTTLAQGSWW